MTFVTVFRRMPQPIAGMIGVLSDSEFREIRAEERCLVTNSLRVRPHLEAVVEFEGA